MDDNALLPPIFDLSGVQFTGWVPFAAAEPHTTLALLCDTSPAGQAITDLVTRDVVGVAERGLDTGLQTASHILLAARHPDLLAVAADIIGPRAPNARCGLAGNIAATSDQLAAVWQACGPEGHSQDGARLVLAHPDIDPDVLADVGRHHTDGWLAQYARMQPHYPADPAVWEPAVKDGTNADATHDPSHPNYEEETAETRVLVRNDTMTLQRWWDRHHTSAALTATLSDRYAEDLPGLADRVYAAVLGTVTATDNHARRDAAAAALATF